VEWSTSPYLCRKTRDGALSLSLRDRPNEPTRTTWPAWPPLLLTAGWNRYCNDINTRSTDEDCSVVPPRNQISAPRFQISQNVARNLPYQNGLSALPAPSSIRGRTEPKHRPRITLPPPDLLQQKRPLQSRQNQLFQSRLIRLSVAPRVHLKSTG